MSRRPSNKAGGSATTAWLPRLRIQDFRIPAHCQRLPIRSRTSEPAMALAMITEHACSKLSTRSPARASSNASKSQPDWPRSHPRPRDDDRDGEREREQLSPPLHQLSERRNREPHPARDARKRLAKFREMDDRPPSTANLACPSISETPRPFAFTQPLGYSLNSGLGEL
jgi:hypothetical protein